jgi:hypothetical protein
LACHYIACFVGDQRFGTTLCSYYHRYYLLVNTTKL